MMQFLNFEISGLNYWKLKLENYKHWTEVKISPIMSRRYNNYISNK
jgi:hypothetical protein